MSIGVIVDFEFKPGGAASLIETMKERLPSTWTKRGLERASVHRARTT